MSNYTNKEIIQIYNSRKNLINILAKRGFDVSGYDNFNINEIQAMKNNDQLDMLLTEKDVENPTKIFIKYNLSNLNQNHIYEIVDDLFQVEEVLTKRDELLILSNSLPNDKIKKLITLIFKRDGYYFNINDIGSYMFNILDHKLVPDHRVMSEEEKQDIKQKYNIVKDSEFPEISRYDPVAIVIGLRPGMVCEITRSSKTAIQSKYYRLCI